MLLRTLVLGFSCLFFFLATHNAVAQNSYAPWGEKQERFAQANPETTFENKTAAPITTVKEQNAPPTSQSRIPVTPLSKAQRFTTPNTQHKTNPSKLEEFYSGRTINEITQFGYDLFGIPSQRTQESLNALTTQKSKPMGAVQDNFILGSGDELEIMFTGQRNDRGLYKVNDQGLVLINDFPPIPTAGRSIGQVRLSLQTAAKNLHNTQAFVSLSSVRQIGVLVIGHVKHPGKQTMTVFHTVLDALMESGGVKKTGSLREIKLVRNGRSTIIDIYGLLMHGNTNMDLNLRDGDRIVVPSIGPTVAIAGEAKRPGIYEIRPDMQGMLHEPKTRSENLTLNEMLELGGGVLAPGKNRFLKLELTKDGKENVQEVKEPFAPLFGDGSILVIAKGKEKRAGTIELIGHTRRPGMHALDENKTLSKLFSSEDILGSDIYPLIGTIERWDTDQLTHKYMSFPLRLVLKGQFDQKLKDGDIIRLYSNNQISSLVPPTNKEIPQGSRDDEDEEPAIIDDPALKSFLLERAATVHGAVRKPGLYPVGKGTTLDSLIAVTGGLSLEANTSNLEITAHNDRGPQRMQINLRKTNPKDIIINPRDSLRVNQKLKAIEDKSVLIIGEVHTPGRYDMIPGDKISDLLERAGGFTNQAYPEGAIFSRESERKAEETRFKNQAREIKHAIAAALEMDDEKVNTAKIAEARALAAELEKAQGIGRMTIEADLAKLKVQPELDMLLEPGDRIYIPKRSLNVRVSGEVLSPAALQFRSQKDPLDYVHEAGGFTHYADKDRSFVLYPDGSAQPLQISAWNHKATFIPPGSTIVVPRDPEPFDFIQSAKDISQILSNLAITAIFIDDVRND